MATTKKSTKSISRAQLLRERKKDHEDIIAKAARITALETEVAGLKGDLTIEKACTDAARRSARCLTEDAHRLQDELRDLKRAVKIVVKVIS